MADERKVVYDIQTIGIRDEEDLKKILATNYMKTMVNFLGNEERARKFMSSIIADVQRNVKLLDCTPVSIFNAYMTMAQLGFMPSAVSGEAYVIPYENNKQINGKWEKVLEAQFQMGYQGLVTLFYKSGVTQIDGIIVRKNDKASYINGEMVHEVPLGMSKEERGEPIGAYVTVHFRGGKNTKYMNGKDIIAHANKFSKSYNPDAKGWKYSPWNPDNDPELTMWMKTVLKQHSKLLPKNETINIAIAADNADSVMFDRLQAAKVESEKLNMGNLEIPHGTKKESGNSEGAAKTTPPTDSDEEQDNEEPPE